MSSGSVDRSSYGPPLLYLAMVFGGLSIRVHSINDSIGKPLILSVKAIINITASYKVLVRQDPLMFRYLILLFFMGPASSCVLDSVRTDAFRASWMSVLLFAPSFSIFGC